MANLNLDPNYTPLVGGSIAFKIFNFPSGCEPHIKIDKGNEHYAFVNITCRIKSMNDLMILFLATDALRRMGTENIVLHMPYLPFARQDRRMVLGEPLSLRVIADLINSQNYKNVFIYDAHSEVSKALINNCINESNHSFVDEVLEGKKRDYLIVSPDAGAYKKIFKLCQYIKYKDKIVLCNKTRDVSNGNITSMTCDTNDFEEKDLYIVDDICDGGGTFIMLADELRKRNCGKINLIVSHGIFSKGIEALHNIDHIYTTNSFKDLESNEKLTQIKL